MARARRPSVSGFQKAVEQAQEFMARRRIPAWLLYDYRGSNPVFRSVVGPITHVTRPSWCLIPRKGPPQLLVHHVDAGKFAALGVDLRTFSSRHEMARLLGSLVAGYGSVAMEYSPKGVLPRASRVDAGTVELVRSLGVRVTSSADLFQYAAQRWSAEQLASHRDAAARLTAIVERAFVLIRDSSRSPTEWEVAEFIRREYAREGMETDAGPVVAVNAHGSDPHFDPVQEDVRSIRQSDWVLIDLWAKRLGLDTIYADITWVGYVGDKVPPQHRKAFNLVLKARDSALDFVALRSRKGQRIRGWEVDRVARNVIQKAGYAKFFTHRLGHSLGGEVHGDAVNLDSWETKDTRELLPGLGFTIEPGVYLPEFGMRSEIDVYLSERGPEVTTPPQRDVVLLG